MNCECCHTPMIWIGSMSRGGMDCPRCAPERPVIVDMGPGIAVATPSENVKELYTIMIPAGQLILCGHLNSCGRHPSLLRSGCSWKGSGSEG